MKKPEILSFLMLLIMKVALLRAQVSIEVNSPLRITTLTNQLANGDCCLSTETPPFCSSCPNLRLRLCLRLDRHDTNDMNINDCFLGPETLSGQASFNIRRSVDGSSSSIYTGAYQVFFQIYRDVRGEPLVDSGLQRVTQQLGQSQQIQLSGSQALATASLQVSVTCPSRSCPTDNSCRPRNDLFGHYICGPGGEIICLPGFQNPTTYCTTSIETTSTTDNTGLHTTTDVPEIPSPETLPSPDTTIIPETTTPEFLLWMGVAIGFTVALVLAASCICIFVMLQRKFSHKQPDKGGSNTIYKEEIPLEPNPGYDQRPPSLHIYEEALYTEPRNHDYQETLHTALNSAYHLETTPNPTYNLKTFPNPAYDLKTFPNPAYDLKTTPNPAYHLLTLPTT